MKYVLHGMEKSTVYCVGKLSIECGTARHRRGEREEGNEGGSAMQ